MSNDAMTKDASPGALGDWSLVIGHSAGGHSAGGVPHFGDARAEYEALTGGAGVVPLLDRTQIDLIGADRAAFLHNLCTNDVKRLAPEQGCEAFFANVQGRTTGHGYIFAGAESLVIETAPHQGATLLAYLDKYLISEKVELHDRTEAWGELLVAGNQAIALLGRLVDGALPTEPLSHRNARIGQHAVSLRRTTLTATEDFLLSTARAALPELWELLCSAGIRACGMQAFEIARIENGTPVYGQDISDKNLPQEVDRDKKAISFTKGCYLGQETVARIDSLGHVNHKLRGLKFNGTQTPNPGTELTLDGKAVGHVTSAAFSPRLNAPLALGYLRREHQQPGTVLQSALGPATVVTLPVA